MEIEDREIEAQLPETEAQPQEIEIEPLEAITPTDAVWGGP